MKLRTIVSAWAVTIAALVTFAIVPAIAQDASGTMGQDNPGYSGARGTANSVAPAKIDDATLMRTARAYVKVRQISQKEDSALNGTSDDATRQKRAQQAESEKVAAVKAEGLQPQQYNQVLQLVQADRSLQQRFLSYVNKNS